MMNPETAKFGWVTKSNYIFSFRWTVIYWCCCFEVMTSQKFNFSCDKSRLVNKQFHGTKVKLFLIHSFFHILTMSTDIQLPQTFDIDVGKGKVISRFCYTRFVNSNYSEWSISMLINVDIFNNFSLSRGEESDKNLTYECVIRGKNVMNNSMCCDNIWLLYQLTSKESYYRNRFNFKIWSAIVNSTDLDKIKKSARVNH